MRFGVGTGAADIHNGLAAAGEAVLAVTRAVEQRFREWPSGPPQDEVKALEHDADRLVSQLLRDVNSALVAPYDREDIVELAFLIDDVADAAENAAELLGLYGVQSTTRHSFELCGLLVRATEELSSLLTGLRKLRGSAPQIMAIKALEDEADDVGRAARVSLFKNDRIDPVIVIRWKDIYDALEEAIDACDTAAGRIGNILVKNA